VYDRAEGELRGVTCADMNMVVGLDTLEAMGGAYDTFKCQYEQVTELCAAPYTQLNDCILEEMRRSAGGACGDDEALMGYVNPNLDQCTQCVDKTCNDVKGFLDEWDGTCDTWVGDDCTTAVSKWGYTEQGQAAVLANCRRSCLLCGWSSDCSESKCSNETSGVAPCRPRSQSADEGGDADSAAGWTSLAVLLLATTRP